MPRKNHPKVDGYLASAPARDRARLAEVRRLLRATLPDAEEVYSYGMPGYSYPGHPYKGMIVWFALRSTFVSLYAREEAIRRLGRRLKGYETTKSAVHFSLEKPLPAGLIQALVRASARIVLST